MYLFIYVLFFLVLHQLLLTWIPLPFTFFAAACLITLTFHTNTGVLVHSITAVKDTVKVKSLLYLDLKECFEGKGYHCTKFPSRIWQFKGGSTLICLQVYQRLKRKL